MGINIKNNDNQDSHEFKGKQVVQNNSTIYNTVKRSKVSDCIVEVYSRVTGFMRPVQDWNKGKTEEYKGRKTFDLKKAEIETKE